MEVLAGVYNVRLSYKQQFVDNVAGVTANGRETFADLPLDQETFEFPVAIKESTDDF